MARTGYGVNLPITKQTDPRNFPDYVYQPYPRMMLETVDAAYVERWRQNNSYIDDRTGKVCYMGASPKLGIEREMLATAEDVEAGFATVVNQPIIVKNADEERAVMASRGKGKPPTPAAKADVQINADASEFKQLKADKAELERKLTAATDVKPKRKYTRRKPAIERVSELP